MKESGFIARQAYKIKFSDLPELFFAGILLRKIVNTDHTFPQSIKISLHDIFPNYKSLAEIETEITGKKIFAKDRNTEIFTDAINFLFKSDFIPKEKEIDILAFIIFT